MSYSDIRPEALEAWLAEEKRNGTPVLILDMRDAASFGAGHLQDAQPADEARIRLVLKNRARPVLVYCYHGHSSRDLSDFLTQMGATRVYNLEGGWHALAAWLDRAESLPSPTLTQWLLLHGFRNTSIHARIDRAMSTLMVAALDGRTDIVAELLELGADIEAINADGNQALWMACVAERGDIIGLLLAAGSDVEHLNENGFNCLMYAASTGKLQVVEQLLAAGADAGAESPEGLNALECAATLPVLRRLRAAAPAH